MLGEVWSDASVVQTSGDAADRLLQANVKDADGFFLSVSNYQETARLEKYGAWVSKCIWFADPESGSWGGGHAHLWVKVPGESDGQCYRWEPPGSEDPVRGMMNPAAGEWFPQMALELATNASPPL